MVCSEIRTVAFLVFFGCQIAFLIGLPAPLQLDGSLGRSGKFKINYPIKLRCNQDGFTEIKYVRFNGIKFITLYFMYL